MHAPKRPKLLTSHIGTRLTPDEAARLTDRASEAGLTASEWLRQTALQALETSPETRLLLAEVLALRKVLLLLHVDVYEGQQPNEARLRRAVELADSTKFAMADKRIQAFDSLAPDAKKEPKESAA